MSTLKQIIHNGARELAVAEHPSDKSKLALKIGKRIQDVTGLGTRATFLSYLRDFGTIDTIGASPKQLVRYEEWCTVFRDYVRTEFLTADDKQAREEQVLDRNSLRRLIRRSFADDMTGVEVNTCHEEGGDYMRIDVQGEHEIVISGYSTESDFKRVVSSVPSYFSHAISIQYRDMRHASQTDLDFIHAQEQCMSPIEVHNAVMTVVEKFMEDAWCAIGDDSCRDLIAVGD